MKTGMVDDNSEHREDFAVIITRRLGLRLETSNREYGEVIYKYSRDAYYRSLGIYVADGIYNINIDMPLKTVNLLLNGDLEYEAAYYQMVFTGIVSSLYGTVAKFEIAKEVSAIHLNATLQMDNNANVKNLDQGVNLITRIIQNIDPKSDQSALQKQYWLDLGITAEEPKQLSLTVIDGTLANDLDPIRDFLKMSKDSEELLELNISITRVIGNPES